MKDDLIRRQAALDVIFPYCPDDDGTCSKNGDDLRNLLDDIENLPPAQTDLSEYSDKLWRSAYERGKRDAQTEIISCNQCVHYQQNHHYCEFLDTEFSPSDYCSYAERREEP